MATGENSVARKKTHRHGSVILAYGPWWETEDATENSHFGNDRTAGDDGTAVGLFFHPVHRFQIAVRVRACWELVDYCLPVWLALWSGLSLGLRVSVLVCLLVKWEWPPWTVHKPQSFYPDRSFIPQNINGLIVWQLSPKLLSVYFLTHSKKKKKKIRPERTFQREREINGRKH